MKSKIVEMQIKSPIFQNAKKETTRSMRPSFDINGMVLDQKEQAAVESYLNRLMKAEKYRVEGDMD